MHDAQNRLNYALVGSNTDLYAYDSKNRVVSRSVNGTMTYLIYDGLDLIEERDSSNNVLATYVHGAMADEMLSKTDTSGTVYYHQNGLGSVVNLTNGSGAVVEQYKYDAFGRAAISDGSGSPLTATAYGNRFLFTGREYLSEVSLYDYRNRVYSASLGRFLQTDPIRFAAGDVNIYRYCGNNPLNLADPSGALSGEGLVLGGLIGGFVGAVGGLSAVIGEDTYLAATGQPLLSDQTAGATIAGAAVAGAVTGAIVGTVVDPDPVAVGALALGAAIVGGAAGGVVAGIIDPPQPQNSPNNNTPSNTPPSNTPPSNTPPTNSPPTSPQQPPLANNGGGGGGGCDGWAGGDTFAGGYA